MNIYKSILGAEIQLKVRGYLWTKLLTTNVFKSLTRFEVIGG